MTAANISTQILKDYVFERPDLGVQTLAVNSLPSGHTTLAASSAAAVFLVVSPRWRPLAAAAGGSYAVVAGAATLINLWHRPSDVLAAFFVVGAWAALAGWIIMRTGTAWNVWNRFGEHWAASRLWPIASAGVGVAAALVSALLLALTWPSILTPADPNRLPLVYVAGLAAIIAVGYLVTAVGIWLFGQAARRRR